MSKLEQVPEFRPATLLPVIAEWQCPCCGHDETVELSEDDAGFFRIPDEDRFIQCPDCEENIDIGWNGWHWHSETDALASAEARAEKAEAERDAS